MQFNIDNIDETLLNHEPFWLDDPFVLFRNLEFIPNKHMTQAERLNALTRLLIIITIGLYMYDMESYKTVLIVGILLILLLRNNDHAEHFSAHRGQFNPCRSCGSCGKDSYLPYIDQKYEVSPHNQYTHLNDGLRSYTHAKYRLIPIDTPAPLRQVWRNDSKWCNEYSDTPKGYTINKNPDMNIPQPKCYFEDDLYVQNTQPCHITDTRKPGLTTRQSAFNRDSNEFRNNIMGEYIDYFMRQRNHECEDYKPGRKTY